MELLVTGGNGFIGKRVCRTAVANGHDATSIARSGPPADVARDAWTDRVEWVQPTCFAPINGAAC
jgi:uncharacterized protein YbjT (DUF2867 family)